MTGDELLDRFHRLVGEGLTLIARKVDLNVGGLAVVALRAGLGQRIAPEILNVLDVLVVGLELVDELVVVVMRIRAEVCRTSSELPLRLAHPVRRSWTVAALAEALETPWKQTPRAAEATAAFEPTGEEV